MIVVAYAGSLAPAPNPPVVVSRNVQRNVIAPARALDGNGIRHVVYTHSTYFGEWRHIETLSGLDSPEKAARWELRAIDPGDYRVTIRYMASGAQAGREGVLEGVGEPLRFQVLQTSDGYSPMRPAAVFEHAIGLVHFDRPGSAVLRLRAATPGPDLLLLQDIVLTPAD